MTLRPLGTGYNPDTSTFPPDDSTGIPYDPEVDLTGYGRFGPGGFAPNPKLTGPASGSQGLSLSANPYGASMPRGVGADIIPPENSTIPNNKSVGSFTGGSATDAIIRGVGKYGLRRIPGLGTIIDMISPTDELAAPTGVELPRTLGRSPTGPGITRGPVPVAPSIATPFTQPQHPNSAAAPLPFESGFPTPAPAATPMPARPVTPTPVRASQPARPYTPTPKAAAPAAPAAAKQKPNLGNYVIDQPNIDPLSRGGRQGGGSAPQMGVFGWDPKGPLFGRGG